MKRGMNKSGQFYLVAAGIIIVLILSFAAVSNYTRTSSNVVIYDLKEELGIEGGEVIDYGVYQNKDVNAKLTEYTEDYSYYAGAGKELYFVYGNNNKVTVSAYQEVNNGNMGLVLGSNPAYLSMIQGEYISKDYPVIDLRDVKVKIRDKDNKESEYSFSLKPGQNFYFVIAQEQDEERYVTSSEQ